MGSLDTPPSGAIAARVASLPDAIGSDPVLLRRGRHLTATCLLQLGEAAFLLRIVDGRIAEARPGPFVTPSVDFAIAGETAIWRRLLAAAPPPGDHDLLAFVKRRELHLTGNLHPLMSHLLYFKGMLACLREPA